jgi:hypothetical protein
MLTESILCAESASSTVKSVFKEIAHLNFKPELKSSTKKAEEEREMLVITISHVSSQAENKAFSRVSVFTE